MQVRRFGTITGVFLPCILSLFGVILFLRTGWVVGNAGLINAEIILAISAFISFITGLSVASIATSAEVGIGGTYYIISRNLGLDVGGAIGVPLYLSQAISIAFYIIGFLETISFINPNINYPLWGTIILLIFTILVFIGADLATKFQYVIFSLLILGIISVFLTPWKAPLHSNLLPHYERGYNFWKVFSVFFPALIGIDAGIGLSGELKNPAKSIPRGIIFSLLISTVVYALFMFKASSLALYKNLIINTNIFIKKSWRPELVFVGIWAATLSSALTYSMTAPRTLQALSLDGVLPKFFSGTLGSKKSEPRIGIIVTFIIAEFFILVGTLNLVASIIAMFFLVCYAFLNLSSSLQTLFGGIFYRPEFKTHWFFTLIGAIVCFIIIFLISPLNGLIIIIGVSLIYIWLRKKRISLIWGDAKLGLFMSLCRWSLLQMKQYSLDASVWRPNIMVFSGNPATRASLVKMGKWLSKGNGIVTLFYLIKIEENSIKDFEPKKKKKLEELRNFLLENRLPFFIEVDFIHDFVRDIPIIAQSHGIEKLSSNIALFGWGHDPERENILLKIISKMHQSGKHLLIFKGENLNKKFFKQIDIWWRGKDDNIYLMLMISEILRSNIRWKRSKIRVLSIVNDNEKEIKEKIFNALMSLKINAEIKVIIDSKVLSTMKKESVFSDLVIMGLPIPEKKNIKETAERINEFVISFKNILLVRKGRDF